jgi:hypothetical protein
MGVLRRVEVGRRVLCIEFQGIYVIPPLPPSASMACRGTAFAFLLVWCYLRHVSMTIITCSNYHLVDTG